MSEVPLYSLTSWLPAPESGRPADTVRFEFGVFWGYSPVKDDRSDFTLWGYNPVQDDQRDFTLWGYNPV